MVLEIDRESFILERALAGSGGGVVLVQFAFIVNEHSVEFNGHVGPGGAVSAVVKFGCGEIDIVGLPGEGRQTHVHVGLGDGVDAATFVHLPIEGEGVEDLGFPAPAEVNPAVSPALSASEGFVGSAKLKVEFVVFEFRLAGGASGLQQSAFHLAILPVFDAGSVEKNGRAFGRLGSEGWAFSLDSLEGMSGLFVKIECESVAGDGNVPLFAGVELDAIFKKLS